MMGIRDSSKCSAVNPHCRKSRVTKPALLHGLSSISSGYYTIKFEIAMQTTILAIAADGWQQRDQWVLHLNSYALLMSARTVQF